MSEANFIYAGDLNEEIEEILELVVEKDNVEDTSSFSVRCGAFFTIYCC